MTARGRRFEAEVLKLLEAAGFEVVSNAKAARPRQTDLFASGHGLDLLVEAKNRSRKIDIGDIDSLRSRLNRVAHDIVGVIFTRSELTREAIKAIEVDRQREVLVFIDSEINRIDCGEQNLKALLERKRKELRIGGKAWFGQPLGEEFTAVNLPKESIAFKIGKMTSSYLETKSKFAGACFALQIPDPGWGMSGGEGARLTIDLAVNTIGELRNIFGYLHAKFGLSKNGMYSIQQSECSWHGAGPENFLETLVSWKTRYGKSKSKRFHHAESVVYFDQFRNGWAEISAQQHLSPSVNQGRDSSLFHGQLVVQLPGVPVDTSPYLKLCQYAGADWANFEFIGSRWTITRRLKRSLKLKTVGLIVDQNLSSRDPHEPTAVGVIARNPFFRIDKLPRELLAFDSGAQVELCETELLPCALRDWHPANMSVDYYLLTGVEITTGGVGYIIRPYGTWNTRLR